MNSPCIEHLGGETYRCKNRGITFETHVLPIHCNCDGSPALPPPRSLDDLEQAVSEHAGRPLEQCEVERLEQCDACRSLFDFHYCLALDTEGCVGARLTAFCTRVLGGFEPCQEWHL